jgi:hypothetical protein
MLQAAFLFALIGIAFFGAYSGARVNEYAANQQTAQHSVGVEHPSFLWHWATHDAVAVWTLLLCVVTGVLAYVTYGLYSATVKLAGDTKTASDAALLASTEATKLAREEFIATHRPKIMVQSFTISDQGAVDRNAIIDFWMANAGESAATITGFLVFGYYQSPESDFLPNIDEPLMQNPQGVELCSGRAGLG